ncbi:MAG: NAD(P)H-hydrate dehydratase [Burkholderiales bacterium]|nr:NAD(P)H-hydrate dehydratase [Burkholderiales bacterium]
MAQPVYLTEDIRRIEAAAGDAPLMERAGAAAAALAASLLADRAKDILVLAGPGNNGGDARVAARILREQFHRVHVATRPSEVPSGARWGLVVDGLFGIGLSRPVEGEYAALVDYANAQRCPVLALDVPSGIASDTGAVLGRAVRATHTITFIALKPGLLTLAGPDHCGALRVATLDLEPEKLLAPQAWVAEPALFAHALRRRPRNFHKGMAGSVAILGGAAGMTGAALLAGRAALKLGAGRVYVGLLDELPVDPGAPELMLRHPDDALGQALDAVVAGPGLGRSARAEVLVGAVLASELPCVLDADALNLIAENPDLAAACARRSADTLLTPHPAEAARLLGARTADVQADRVGAARQLARRFSAHALLKGAGSVIAARDGHWFVNTSGNPGMASAGMGDVLSGILGALLAQGVPGEAALALGAHLHGCAADECVAAGAGPVGLAASETIEPARRLWNRWLEGRDASTAPIRSDRTPDGSGS